MRFGNAVNFGTIDCIICLDRFFREQCYPSTKESTCGHATCTKCLCLYLKQLPQGEYHLGYISLACPDPLCKATVKTYVDSNVDLRAAACNWWKSLFQEKANFPYKIICPLDGCGQVLESNKQLAENCTIVVCRSCHRGFCSACVNKWHTNVIEQPANRTTNSELRRRSLETAKDKNWCVCPKCRCIIEKTGGCQHIRCYCGADICYRCGRLVSECRDLCNSFGSVVIRRLREGMFQ